MKEFEIRLVSISSVKDFIEHNHYSKSVNGIKSSYVFGLFKDDILVGAVVYGQLSTTAWKKYSNNEEDVIELRRLVSTDKTPNLLSWFVGKTLNRLKTISKIKTVVSYADQYHGHIGFIYQATNFEYHGKTNADVLLETPDGKLYHSRALRTKYKGKLKPFAERLTTLQKEGKLKTISVPGKHIYVYPLRKSPNKILPYPKSS